MNFQLSIFYKGLNDVYMYVIRTDDKLFSLVHS